MDRKRDRCGPVTVTGLFGPVTGPYGPVNFYLCRGVFYRSNMVKLISIVFCLPVVFTKTNGCCLLARHLFN